MVYRLPLNPPFRLHRIIFLRSGWATWGVFQKKIEKKEENLLLLPRLMRKVRQTNFLLHFSFIIPALCHLWERLNQRLIEVNRHVSAFVTVDRSFRWRRSSTHLSLPARNGDITLSVKYEYKCTPRNENTPGSLPLTDAAKQINKWWKITWKAAVGFNISSSGDAGRLLDRWRSSS